MFLLIIIPGGGVGSGGKKRRVSSPGFIVNSLFFTSVKQHGRSSPALTRPVKGETDGVGGGAQSFIYSIS